MKIGRNDPCPCGSGKKYKKCCGAKVTPEFELPENLSTGTFLDEYQLLLRPIAMYYEMLIQYDDDRKELSGAEKEFERDFRPGTPGGVPDSLFMPWLYFDFRFGKTGKTVCERFLESSWMKDLNEPAPTLIRHMSDSYSTFYQVTGVSKDRITFTELITGKIWDVHRISEPEERETKKGDIWYVRFVGHPEDAYIFSAPYIYPAEAKAEFEKAIKAQSELLAKSLGRPIAVERIFTEACKAAVPLWAEYFVYGPALRDRGREGSRVQVWETPTIVNRDGELLRFCKLYFKIIAEEGLREKLSSLRSIDYDEHNRIWVWFRKEESKKGLFSATTLGTISIKRGRLIAECNSEGRALKLMDKLKRGLRDFVSFEKMEAKDISDMPSPTEKQRKKFEKEQAELNADPEVQEFLRKQAESYYHDDWMERELPMLGNKTPVAAVRTKEGRERVKTFLDDLEASQKARPTDPFRVDVDGLRKRLGLIQ